jgi:hypothetical protein
MSNFGAADQFNPMVALIDSAVSMAQTCRSVDGDMVRGCNQGVFVSQVQGALAIAQQIGLSGLANVLQQVANLGGQNNWPRAATRIFDAKLMAKKAQKTQTNVGDPTNPSSKDAPLPPEVVLPPPPSNTWKIVVGVIVALAVAGGAYYFTQMA